MFLIRWVSLRTAQQEAERTAARAASMHGCVIMKKMLLVICALLALLSIVVIYASLQVRATPAETAQTLPGDELIPQPIASVNHAITIRRPPRSVWPWLVQMGAGRAGWYSYDFIDNGGHRSAERIIPAYQKVAVGAVFPAVPGAPDVFVVAQYEPDRSLVLAWRLPSGKYQTTWSFALEQSKVDQTRLVVRGRVASGYHPFGLPQWIALPLGGMAHFIMERKQLIDIATRAGSLP